jgi:hypothetical protein
MGLIKDEPVSGSEASVTTLDDGTEDGNLKVEEFDTKVEEFDTKVEANDIKVEELVDIKEENPEVIKFPAIKTEPEVCVWGFCVRQQQCMLPGPFTATKRGHPKIYFFYLYICTMHFVLDQLLHIYTGCPRRNVPDFGRVFLMLKYTDITQNTHIHS